MQPASASTKLRDTKFGQIIRSPVICVDADTIQLTGDANERVSGGQHISYRQQLVREDHVGIGNVEAALACWPVAMEWLKSRRTFETQLRKVLVSRKVTYADATRVRHEAPRLQTTHHVQACEQILTTLVGHRFYAGVVRSRTDRPDLLHC